MHTVQKLNKHIKKNIYIYIVKGQSPFGFTGQNIMEIDTCINNSDVITACTLFSYYVYDKITVIK